MYNAYTEIFQQGAHLHRVLKSMLSRKEDIRTFFAENDYGCGKQSAFVQHRPSG